MGAACDGDEQDLAPRRGIGQGTGGDSGSHRLMLAGEREAEPCGHHLA